MGYRHQCAAESGVRDGGSSPAIGVQARVANHRKRLELKALVVSVTEKASEKVSGVNQRRRTTVNHRSSVESAQMTSKLKSDVASGLVWRDPGSGSCVELREPSMAMQRERHKCKKQG